MGQLVLSRNPGERIYIGENITLTVVRIGPNTVRIAIEAPREMNITRGELIDKPRPLMTTQTKELGD